MAGAGLPGRMEPADEAAAEEFARSLPDHPFSFEARCLLQRGLGRAYLLGSPSDPSAAVVLDPWLPTEPMGFGSDPEAIWTVLREIPGWNCVSVPSEVAPGLAGAIQRDLGSRTELYDDVYFLLENPPKRFAHPSVRRLTEDDLALVEEAPLALRPEGFLSTLAALTGGVAAGGVVKGELVASVSMSSSSEEYANMVAHTLEPWRNQGLGTAAGCLVAQELISRDLTPVWSTGEDNRRSRRVAEKLGFHEFGRKKYVIVPSRRSDSGPEGRPGSS